MPHKPQVACNGQGNVTVSGELSSSCVGPRIKPELTGTRTAQESKESSLGLTG